jgi:dCTP deaminase
LIVKVTPPEPEWEGMVTIEISDITPIHADAGISRFPFRKAEAALDMSRSNHAGQYMHQRDLALPRL